MTTFQQSQQRVSPQLYTVPGHVEFLNYSATTSNTTPTSINPSTGSLIKRLMLTNSSDEAVRVAIVPPQQSYFRLGLTLSSDEGEDEHIEELRGIFKWNHLIYLIPAYTSLSFSITLTIPPNATAALNVQDRVHIFAKEQAISIRVVAIASGDTVDETSLIPAHIPAPSAPPFDFFIYPQESSLIGSTDQMLQSIPQLRPSTAALGNARPVTARPGTARINLDRPGTARPDSQPIVSYNRPQTAESQYLLCRVDPSFITETENAIDSLIAEDMEEEDKKETADEHVKRPTTSSQSTRPTLSTTSTMKLSPTNKPAQYEYSERPPVSSIEEKSLTPNDTAAALNNKKTPVVRTSAKKAEKTALPSPSKTSCIFPPLVKPPMKTR